MVGRYETDDHTKVKTTPNFCCELTVPQWHMYIPAWRVGFVVMCIIILYTIQYSQCSCSCVSAHCDAWSSHVPKGDDVRGLGQW